MSEATSHREVEFKFRVGPDTDLDLPALLGSLALDVVEDEPRDMVATYYDTSTLSLLRWGITLRNRIGGGDDGWHMKVPAEPSGDAPARDEIHLDASPSSVPGELASIVAPLTRRRELQAMATVRTRRRPFIVRDAAGADMIEVVDDLVDVVADSTPDERTSFHEVEVELLADSELSQATAATISKALVNSGAEPSSMSKAAQALGPAAGDPPDVPKLAFPTAAAPAIDALRAIFSSYVRDLLIADVGVRRGTADATHQMRVACRRLRSALKTFHPLLDTDSVDYLRDELQWLASELGEVRDTEVQRSRLLELTDDTDVEEFLTRTLESRMRAATSSALAALRSDRHDLLIEDLILLVSEPPVTTIAFDPAASRLRSCLQDPWRRLRKAVHRASVEGPADQWHTVRIRAKQARYAAEAAAPVLGRDFSRLGKALAKATDILGDRQDAHVTSLLLRELAVEAPGPIAFELGWVAARSEISGNDDIRSFLEFWPDIVLRARKSGLD